VGGDSIISDEEIETIPRSLVFQRSGRSRERGGNQEEAMLHQHPYLELELYHLERKDQEQKLQVARQLGEGRERKLGQLGRVMRVIGQAPRSVRESLRARSVSDPSALPSRKLLDCAE
jgi:hypothetical protein